MLVKMSLMALLVALDHWSVDGGDQASVQVQVQARQGEHGFGVGNGIGIGIGSGNGFGPGSPMNGIPLGNQPISSEVDPKKEENAFRYFMAKLVSQRLRLFEQVDAGRTLQSYSRYS